MAKAPSLAEIKSTIESKSVPVKPTIQKNAPSLSEIKASVGSSSPIKTTPKTGSAVKTVIPFKESGNIKSAFSENLNGKTSMSVSITDSGLINWNVVRDGSGDEANRGIASSTSKFVNPANNEVVVSPLQRDDYTLDGEALMTYAEKNKFNSIWKTNPTEALSYWKEIYPTLKKREVDNAGFWERNLVTGLNQGISGALGVASLATDIMGNETSDSLKALLGASKEYAGGAAEKNAKEGNELAGGIVQGFAQFIPQVLMYAFNPILGGVSMGVTAGGSYSEMAKDSGATITERLIYGAAGGAAEVLLQKVLFLDKLLGKVFVKGIASSGVVQKGILNMAKSRLAIGSSLLQQAAGEFAEEALINPVTGLVEKITFNKDKEWTGEGGVLDVKQMAYDGLIGGIVGGGIATPKGLISATQLKDTKAYIDEVYPQLLVAGYALPDTSMPVEDNPIVDVKKKNATLGEKIWNKASEALKEMKEEGAVPTESPKYRSRVTAEEWRTSQKQVSANDVMFLQKQVAEDWTEYAKVMSQKFDSSIPEHLWAVNGLKIIDTKVESIVNTIRETTTQEQGMQDLDEYKKFLKSFLEMKKLPERHKKSVRSAIEKVESIQESFNEETLATEAKKGIKQGATVASTEEDMQAIVMEAVRTVNTAKLADYGIEENAAQRYNAADKAGVLGLIEKGLEDGKSVIDIGKEIEKKTKGKEKISAAEGENIASAVALMQKGIAEGISKEKIEMELTGKNKPVSKQIAEKYEGVKGIGKINKAYAKQKAQEAELTIVNKDMEGKVIGKKTKQTSKLYKEFESVMELVKKNVWFRGMEFIFSDKRDYVYWTEKEVKEHGYRPEDYIKDSGGKYRFNNNGFHDNNNAGGRILLFKGANRETILEELIHAVQSQIIKINPEFAKAVEVWNANLLTSLKAEGVVINEGQDQFLIEQFAHAVIASELGWADGNRKVAEAYGIDSEVVASIKEILGKDLFEALLGEELPSTPKQSRAKVLSFSEVIKEGINNKTIEKQDSFKTDKDGKPLFQLVQVDITSDLNRKKLNQPFTVDVSVPENIKSFDDSLPYKKWNTIEDAMEFVKDPVRLSDYQEKVTKALANKDLELTKEKVIKYQDGKTGGTANIILTKGCGRNSFLAELVLKGIAERNTDFLACYGGTCFVNLKMPNLWGEIDNINIIETEHAPQRLFDKWFKDEKNLENFNNAILLRHGVEGDDSNTIATGFAVNWLQHCKDAGITTRNVFISAGYAPVTDEQYRELAEYNDISVLHVSTSAWFPKNQNLIRLAEFQRAKAAGVNVILRFITNKDNVSGTDMTTDYDWMMDRFIEMGVNQNEVLETPFHDDRYSKDMPEGYKNQKQGIRSKPTGDFLNVCCETSQCISCSKQCGNNPRPHLTDVAYFGKKDTAEFEEPVNMLGAGIPITKSYSVKQTEDYSKDYSAFTSARVDRLYNQLSVEESSSQRKYAKGYVTKISTDAFLELTTNERVMESLEEESEPLDIQKMRKESQPIFLDINMETGRVMNHEGRHRVIALQKQGIKSVPIVVFPYGSFDKYSMEKVDSLQIKGQMLDFTKKEYAKGEYTLENILPVSREYESEIRSTYVDDSIGFAYSVKPLSHGEDFAPVMYSKLQKTIGIKMQNSSTPEQVLNLLRSQNVKEDEIKWSGINTFLEGKQKVSKQELVDFLRASELNIVDIMFEESQELRTALKDAKEELADTKSQMMYILEKNNLNDTQIGDFFADLDMDNVPEELSSLIDEDLWQRYDDAQDMLMQVEFEIEGEENTWQLPNETFKQHYTVRKEKSANYRELLFTIPDVEGTFTVPAHWDDTENVFAHARMSDVTSGDGKRVLFIEEVQSDWHEEGLKKGYFSGFPKEYAVKLEYAKGADVYTLYVDGKQTEFSIPIAILQEEKLKLQLEFGSEYKDNFRMEDKALADLKITYSQNENRKVPDAPFKKNWNEYVMKRLIRMAAEEGYDRIAWTTGQQQADFYNLQKEVREINWKKKNDGTYSLFVYGIKSDTPIINESNASMDKIASLFGKDIARQISENDNGNITGDNLKIGGTGMKNFYDIGGASSQNIPRFLNKYGKQWGASVEEFVIGKDLSGIYDNNGNEGLVELAKKVKSPSKSPTYWVAPSMKITDAMRESVLTVGQELFQVRQEPPLTEMDVWMNGAYVKYDGSTTMKAMIKNHRIDSVLVYNTTEQAIVDAHNVVSEKGGVRFQGAKGMAGIILQYFSDLEYFSVMGENDIIVAKQPKMENPYNIELEYELQGYSGKVQPNLSVDSTDSPVSLELAYYFKDSMVRNAMGKLLRLYHGTGFLLFAEEGTFDYLKFKRTGLTDDGEGYFSVFKRNSHFGSEPQANEKAMSGSNFKYKTGNRIYPVYLDIKNPMRTMDENFWVNAIQRAKDKGHDGIVYLNRYEGVTFKKNGFTPTQQDFVDLIAETYGENATRTSITDEQFLTLFNAQDSYIIFNENQVKSVFNEKPTKKKDIMHSLKQADEPDFKNWFKESKVITELGSPKKVFHGTPFDIGGSKFYFTDNKMLGDDVGKFYLSLKNPLDVTDGKRTITDDQILDIISSGDAKPIDEDYQQFIINAKGYSDRQIVQILAQGYKNPEYFLSKMEQVLEYDGIIDTSKDANIYVAFNPKQIAMAYDSPKESVQLEEGKTIMDNKEATVSRDGQLVAVHNLTIQNLKDSMALGGMPMPSIAITKKELPFVNFGDVTLVFNKDTINPALSTKNKVYGTDAWTPTMPPLKYKASESVVEKIYNKMKSIFGNEYGEYMMPLDTTNMTDTLQRNDGDAVKALKDNVGFQTAFLMENKNFNPRRYKTIEDGGKLDYYATKDVAKAMIAENESAYLNWLSNLFDGVIEKRGLRNNKDLFLPSGKRRSWESLHDEFNIDNIMKLMLSGEQKGTDSLMYSSSTVEASASKEYKTIKAIKQDSGRLNIVSEEDYQAIKNESADKMLTLIEDIDTNHDNIFDGIDYIAQIMGEVAQKGFNTPDRVQRYFKQQIIEINREKAQEILDYIDYVREIPTGYFEAKPKRVVYFSEVKRAIVPANTEQEVIDRLYELGVGSVTDYNNEEMIEQRDTDRWEEVITTPDVLFSLSQSSAEKLANWFGDSKITDENGNPRMLYRSNHRLLETEGEFHKVLDMIFLTTSKEFAETWKIHRGDREVYPVYVYAQNPFDWRNEAQRAEYIEEYKILFEEAYEEERMTKGNANVDALWDMYVRGIERGDYMPLEEPFGIQALKNLGYDAMWEVESGWSQEQYGAETLAIFDYSQAKSVDAKEFDRGSNNIFYSISQEPEVKIEKFYKTFTNTDVSKRVKKKHEKALKQGLFNYDVLTNDTTMTEARLYIDKKGIKFVEDWVMSDEPATALMYGCAMLLQEHYMNKKIIGLEYRTGRVVDITVKVSEKAKNQGQAIQALSMWGRLSPEGIIRYATKLITDSMTLRQKAEVMNYAYALKQSFDEIDAKAIEKIDIPEIVMQVKNERDVAAEQAKNIAAILATAVEGDDVSIMADTLLRYAKERFPSEDLPSPMEFVAAAIRDRKKYKEVWRRTQVELWDMIPDEQKNDLITSRFFNYTPTSFVESSKLHEAIDEELKEMETSIKEIVLSSYKNQESDTEAIIEALMKKVELSRADAEMLERKIRAKLGQMTEATKRSIANSMLGEKKQGQPSTAIDRLIKMSNIGALTDSQYQFAVGEKLGIHNISPQFLADLHQKAQMLQMMDGDERIEQSARILDDISSMLPVSVWRKVSMIQTLAQLLNPVTFLRNIYGNTGFAIAEYIADNIAVPLDVIAYHIGKTEIGKRKGFGGVRTTYFRPLQKLKVQKEAYIGGFKKSWREVGLGIDTKSMATKFDVPYSRIWRKGAMSSLERILAYELRTFDSAAYAAAYADSLSEQMIAQKVSEPTEEMIHNAHLLGLYRTFQDDTALSQMMTTLKGGFNKVGFGKQKGVKGSTNKFGFGDLVIKYPRTPANLLARGIEYSPAGLVISVVKFAADTSDSPYLRQKLLVSGLGRTITGTALIIIGAVMTQMGMISGGKDDEEDKDLLQLKKAMGIGEYQANKSAIMRWLLSGGIFGGDSKGMQAGDKLTTYNWFQPMAILVALGADIEKNVGVGGLATNLIVAIEQASSTLVEQPLLRGISTLFGANAYGTAGDRLTQGIANTVQGMPASFMPSILNRLTQAMFNEARNPYNNNDFFRTGLNLMQQKTPLTGGLGFIPEVESYTTPFGDDSVYYKDDKNWVKRTFDAFLNPAYENTYSPDELSSWVVKLTEARPDLDGQIAPSSKPDWKYDVEVDGETKQVKLTQSEYKDLSVYQGKRMLEEYQKIYGRYGDLENETQVDRIVRAISRAKDDIRDDVFDEMKRIKGLE